MRMGKTLRVVLPAMALVVGSAGFVGCKTDQPGVKSTYRSQWTTVKGSTHDVTEASEDVLNSMDLKNVKSTSTKVDGQTTGFQADGTKVWVNVKRIDDMNSQVSVQVGKMGDPELGKRIIAKLESKLMK